MDHYLIFTTISQCVFIATANVLDTIPPALKDRLEIINLSGYINEEKIRSAPISDSQSFRRIWFEQGTVSTSQKTLEKLIQEYTRETGVRGLENN